MKKKVFIILVIVLVLLFSITFILHKYKGPQEIPNDPYVDAEERFNKIFNQKIILAINSSQKYEYINGKGENVFNEVFLEAFDFKYNKAIVKCDDGWYIINNGGKKLSGPYKSVNYLFNNYEMYKVESNDGWYILNSNLTKLSEKPYSYVGKGQNDLIEVIQNGRWCAIDKNGNIVMETLETTMTVHEGNYIKTRNSEGKYTLYNKNREILFENYDDIKVYGKNVIQLTDSSNQKFLVNENNQPILSAEYETFMFMEGNLFAYKSGLYYLLNYDGTNKMNIGLSNFSIKNGFIFDNTIKGRTALYSLRGDLLYEDYQNVISPETILYDEIKNRLYLNLKTKDGTQLYEILNKELTKLELYNIVSVNNNLFVYNKDNKYVIVTIDGVDLLKSNCLNKPIIKKNYIIYDDNGLYGILDKDGKELIKPQYKQFPSL